MSYTVLARRYRSSTFDEVIGQEAIAKTLLNAIAQGRVAHAYLFTGTRGVGKTTTARLFARALNAPDSIPGCPKPGFIGSDSGAKKGKKKKDDGEHEYPPKDVQQRMADAIMTGQDLNVIEIDGASNNGVEQARQLISNAGLAPTGNALYKIYIIDEVHMLSTAAFNALLKTMEEPPSHVKFILCTTEAHKVPPTIQSRCQRFDFRNIPTAKIADHLKTVLKQEKVKADDEVVWQLARLGNGSMRDALSLLDRLLATGESPLTSKVLEDMLGLPAPQLIIELVDAFAAGDVGASLAQAAALLSRGISEDQIIEVLIDRLRTLMLIAACGPESDLIELSDDAKSTAAAQAAKFDSAGLVHMIALCEHVSRSMRQSSNPRALLDATVVRLALAEKMADVAALLAGRASISVDPKKKVVEGEGQGPGVRGQGSGVRSQQEAGTSRYAPPQRVPSPPASATPSAPASPPSAEPAEPVRPASDAPADIWAAVLQQVRGSGPLSWVAALSLRQIDERTANLALVPGKRDMHRFVSSDRQREQLATLLRQVLGRPVRVEIDPAQASAQAAPAGPSSSQSIRTQREEALALPLVREVMNVFDAALVEARPETDAERESVPRADAANNEGDDEPAADESL